LGKISDGTLKKIAELRQEGIQGWLAESYALNDMIKDTGIHLGNFSQYIERTTGVMYQMRDGFMDVHEGSEIVGAAFKSLVDAAEELGIEGSRKLLDFIRTTRELGLEIKEVTDYVNEKLNLAAGGFADAVGAIGKESMDAYYAMMKLKDDKADLIKRARELQDIMESKGVGSKQYKEARDELEKLREQMPDLNRDIDKYQSQLDNVGQATKDRVTDLGLLLTVTFGAMQSQGMSVIDIFGEMGEGLTALRDRYTAFGMEIPEYLASIFRMFDAFKQKPEVFKGLQGLMQIFEGLGSSVYLTVGAFDALMREAKNYWDLLQRSKAKGGLGLPEEDAIRMLYPMLQQGWWYAEQYGMKLPKWMQDAVDKAKSFGLKFEKPAVEKQIDLMQESIGVAEDQFDAIRESNDLLWQIKNNLQNVPGYQHGTPYIGSSHFARIHQGEAIVPSNLADAMRQFFTGSMSGDLGGGSGMLRAEINVDGQRVYKALVPYIREGGDYADYEVSGDGVF
jgi:hypothetical protein